MKLTKHLLSVITAMALIICLALPLAASAEETVTVTLRIEGINSNIYCSEVTVASASKVIDVLISVDASNDALTVTGADTGYVTDINGDAAGTFGGWDGWLYRVNETEPSVSMSDYAVAEGDEIVVYYGDPYGVGMQYPVMDDSEIADGVLRFTSLDTTYDADYNPTVSENPVVGMTVTVGEAEYVTDAEGKITVDPAVLTAGTHKVSVSKISEAGIPLVLRLAPDASVTVEETDAESSAPVSESAPENSEPIAESSEAPTETTPGDASHMVIFALIALFAVIGSAAVVRNRK